MKKKTSPKNGCDVMMMDGFESQKCRESAKKECRLCRGDSLRPKSGPRFGDQKWVRKRASTGGNTSSATNEKSRQKVADRKFDVSLECSPLQKQIERRESAQRESAPCAAGEPRLPQNNTLASGVFGFRPTQSLQPNQSQGRRSGRQP
jgi:hypothetical protein